MKKTILALLLGCTAMLLQAQEYKVRKNTGKLLLKIPRVIVEAATGDEIIFQSTPLSKSPSDPNEAGMRVITDAACSDNTGLGISVTEVKDVMTVCEVTPDKSYTIRVPRGVIVTYIGRSTTDSTPLVFKNLPNEIEVDTYLNDIILQNVSGPLTVSSVYGTVKVSFSEPIRGPISVTAVHKPVDVTIPVNAKLSIHLRSARNTIMAAPELIISVDHPTTVRAAGTGTFITGTMNGGGQDFRLTSLDGKIYLRKSE